LLIYVSLTLVSCGSPQAELDYLSTLTPVSKAVTHTHTFAETKTARTTITDTITSTPTISEPILTTPTPIPTLSPSDAEALVTSLLRDNGDCDFPCWWGFTPGDTEIISFASFFDTLGNFSETFHGENGVNFYIEFPVNDKYIRLYGSGFFDEEGKNIEWINVFTEIDREIEGGYEIEYGDPLYFEYLMRYSLAHFLSTYGEPSNVLVYVSDSWWPLSLILDYEELGIFVNFQMPVEGLGDHYKACPSEAVARLWLWSADNKYTLSEVLEENNGIQYVEPASLYVAIEEATGISMNEFVDIFSDPTNSSCIFTPITLWQ
jgi:hypothetical protein